MRFACDCGSQIGKQPHSKQKEGARKRAALKTAALANDGGDDGSKAYGR